MTNKLVVLKLVGLHYTGNSIGDDITIEVVLAGKLISLNKKLAVGQSATLNTEIGQFVTSQTSFSIAGIVRIIERDPVFNDSGETAVNIKVNLRDTAPQRTTYVVDVAESPKLLSGNVAQFEVTFEALAMQATRFVADKDDGWLRVLIKDIRDIVSLPAALKLELTQLDNKRDYFRILEGAYRGRIASVKRNNAGSSDLSTIDPHSAPVKLVYSISKKTLRIKSMTFQTKDYPGKPWSKGLYDVEIPDFPHAGGSRYPQVTRAKTWFRVGHTGDRYIHTGQNSLGCITVIERDRWDTLYAMLITARKGDGVSIGTLEVVD